MALDLLKTDLHMHTTVSDGTDTPGEILSRVEDAGISLFSVTDHDAIKGGLEVLKRLRSGGPAFVTGVEFSCRDELGQYHILGYGYDPASPAINKVVDRGHGLRLNKLRMRLKFLESEFGVRFPKKELDALFALDNPGKPHIGNLMTKLGITTSKEQAIKEFIDKVHIRSEYVRPEEAVRGILESGGIPVLAHPSYGKGDQLILGQDMYERLVHLTGFGLQGVEAFYSTFSPRMQREMLGFADQFDLFVTAGSDYHGANKLVVLGDTGLADVSEVPERLEQFCAAVRSTAGFTEGRSDE